MKAKDTSFEWAQGGAVNNLTVAEQQVGYVPNTQANADDVNFKLKDLDSLMNSLWLEITTLLGAVGATFNASLTDQILNAILELIDTTAEWNKGYINGGIPNYVSGTELQFSELKARSDDDTFNISGGLFNKTTSKPFAVGSGNAGLVSDATNAWNIAGADDTTSTSTPSGSTQPEGLIWLLNGTRLFIADNAGNQITQYNPTIPYDATTKGSVIFNLSTTAQGNAPFDICATGDALDIYVINDGGNDIDQYTMTTAGELSTASFANAFDVGGEEANGRGIDIDDTADTLVLVGTEGDGIDEYTFGTSRDVTTLSHIGFVSLASMGISENAVESIRFGKSGEKLYILGSQNDSIFEFDLPTPYHPFTNINYTGKAFYVGGQDTASTGFEIRPDGLELYLTGDSTNNIYTYNMDTILNTSIHAFGISKSSDGTYDVVYDTDPDGANISTDPIAGAYDKKRRIGSFRTDSNGDILGSTSYEKSGGGIEISFKQKISIYNGTGSGYTASRGFIASGSPSGIFTKSSFSVVTNDNDTTTRYILFTDINQDDSVPSESNQTITTRGVPTDLATRNSNDFEIMSDENAQIYMRTTAAIDGLSVMQNSYTDERIS